jgi:carbamoyl-phosphate synthase large subunit
MPRREDIGSVLVIGSGPIQIGQACEFDYSGTQACRALRAEGYRVVLVNSNPATIMTDPEFADRTYLEPLTADALTKIVERERPDAVLPTLGGQTALNLTMELSRAGVLDRCGITVLGADPETIQLAERRDEFRTAMHEIGLEVPDAAKAHSVEEARAAAERIGYPVMVRPSFILGGAGTGVAHDVAQLERIAENALRTSPVHEVLVEQSIAGWKEYELEVMRDRADNCVVVCSIENVDPVGVHTGDSLTVAPAQTLSDVEYQRMRDAAFACIRRVGVETGGSNVQFAVHPGDGRMMIIEMNPRVSRSSALASKATGFPIAKIATLLAVGYTLDEIRNDITRETPACFEPALDYVVTKMPRWGFEKFAGVPDELGTKMQSIGEAMAIGRTFPESLQKCLRSLETGRLGLNADAAEERVAALPDDDLRAALATPAPDRIFCLEVALRRGFDPDEIVRLSGIDAWFVAQIARIAAAREELADCGGPDGLSRSQWRRYRRLGFCDAQLAWLWRESEERVRQARIAAGVRTTFKSVDTCAAEFAAVTPYFYATTEDGDDLGGTGKPTVVILGSGPNRIGQGVEFDYCCVQASLALRDAGYETVIINCNPETVSTDYDVSDRLYFEPLTPEDVRAIVESERERGELVGVIATLGGQTAVNLAATLPPEWLLGTGPDAIALAEDRDQWAGLCHELSIPQPDGETADSIEQAREVADRIGFPLLLRPSFVLSGRGMQIIDDAEQLDAALEALADVGDGRPAVAPGRPLLLDRFVRDAVELDVDLLRDRTGEVFVGAIMEHIEQAGVHSGDSACVIPPQTLPESTLDVIRAHSEALAGRLGVQGLLNIQFGVRPGPDGEVFVIEANPRASRTVPFASKAVGVPLARLAARIAVGATLAELRDEGLPTSPDPAGRVFVKEVVLPFDHFPDSTDHLGPEMRSTGEVLGMGRDLAAAYAKSQSAAGQPLRPGRAWLTGRSPDDGRIRRLARRFRQHEFEVRTSPDPAAVAGKEADLLVHLNDSPHRELDDASRELRATALREGIPFITTDRAAEVAAAAAGTRDTDVVSIQELHPK